jgi:hypothetical protein
MAFFNVPIRSKEHAAGALRAALEIQSKMAGLSDSFGFPLKSTAGVAIGYARVGSLGSQDIKDYSAIGEVVNLAARLQSQARPGEVMADRRVYEAVAADHAGMVPERIALKGFAEPVEAYRFLSNEPPPAPAPHEHGSRRSLLGIGNLVFAALGAPCAAVATLSPLALLLGIGSTAGAVLSFAGPVLAGLDARLVRLPLLSFAVLGAIANLTAALHARRIESRARAGGELILATGRERRITRWTVGLSIASLCVVVAEILSHHFLMHNPWF